MGITLGQIIVAVKEKGCKTFKDIQLETESGTICGSCENYVQEILNVYINQE